MTIPKEAGANSASASLISPCRIRTLSSIPFSCTLRIAISALSGWISSPVSVLQSDLADIRIGMIPVPVPRSSRSSRAMERPAMPSWMKPVRSTASIPKQNLAGSWMILNPLR